MTISMFSIPCLSNLQFCRVLEDGLRLPVLDSKHTVSDSLGIKIETMSSQIQQGKSMWTEDGVYICFEKNP
jgi:hypothetical protein